MILTYRRLLILIFAIFFAIIHENGFAADKSKKESINIQKGKEIYHERCAACHGLDGNPILPVSPNFAKGERMEKTDKELLQTIRNGKEPMPAWKDILKEDELKKVLAYVRVVTGDKVFEDKCLRCHISIPKLRAGLPDEKALKNFEGPLDICRSCEIEKDMTNEELIEVIKYIRAF
ncbi:MAG: cytochrome c [Deltaproteobacteria bacterium]|nr:cytochrome c [Deltaproteobacteria bacterium]